MPTFEEQLIEDWRSLLKTFNFEQREPNEFEIKMNSAAESFLLEKTRQVRETTLKEVGEMVESKKKDYIPTGDKYFEVESTERTRRLGYNQCLSDLQKIIKELQ